MGRLNAKIDLKSSEMAGNESKINKRNNNFANNFNRTLFLISIRHMIKKNLLYLRLVPLLGHRPPTRVLQLSLSWAFEYLRLNRE